MEYANDGRWIFCEIIIDSVNNDIIEPIQINPSIDVGRRCGYIIVVDMTFVIYTNQKMMADGLELFAGKKNAGTIASAA